MRETAGRRSTSANYRPHVCSTQARSPRRMYHGGKNADGGQGRGGAQPACNFVKKQGKLFEGKSGLQSKGHGRLHELLLARPSPAVARCRTGTAAYRAIPVVIS